MEILFLIVYLIDEQLVMHYQKLFYMKIQLHDAIIINDSKTRNLHTPYRLKT
jgi:hypothetical protein